MFNQRINKLKLYINRKLCKNTFFAVIQPGQYDKKEILMGGEIDDLDAPENGPVKSKHNDISDIDGDFSNVHDQADMSQYPMNEVDPYYPKKSNGKMEK